VRTVIGKYGQDFHKAEGLYPYGENITQGSGLQSAY
jgi:hypothetical protein